MLSANASQSISSAAPVRLLLPPVVRSTPCTHTQMLQPVLSPIATAAASVTQQTRGRRRVWASAAMQEEAVADEDVAEPFHEDGSDPNAELATSLPMIQAANTRVRSAEYVKSCVSARDCPAPEHPEFAVIGRSNVGKSSLVNMLTNSRRLAHVSKEPGKTRCINHFLINNSWYLVDLPGYGFARTGLATRGMFDKFTREYFTTRKSLALVYLLVDSSIAPQRIDLEYAQWLHEHRVPYALVFTKADKRKKGAPPCRENVGAFKQALLAELERPRRKSASKKGSGQRQQQDQQQHESASEGEAEEAAVVALPPTIVTSAETGLGRTALLHLTSALRDALAGTGRLDEAMVDWKRAQLYGASGGNEQDEEEQGVQGSGSEAGGQGASQQAPRAGSKGGKGGSLTRSSKMKKKAVKVHPGDLIPLPPQWTVRAAERTGQQSGGSPQQQPSVAA